MTENFEEPYDMMLAEIAGRLGGLDPLLNTFFGFLHRKTGDDSSN